MRYFITFAYNGTAYHGWQYQPNAITVQEVLEDKLSKLLGTQTKLIAAGRTDTGVHATQMVAHFDSSIANIPEFIYRLNAFLPSDIAIKKIQEVREDAHARFDAVARTYKYYVNYHKNPFAQDTSWYWKYEKLYVERMNAGAAILLDYIDFTSFARLHTDNKTNDCKIYKAVWGSEAAGLVFTISANRFLRNMVRAIVGTLVEVGSGKISLNELRDIIEQKDRKFASASAPAKGLFLTQVDYPDDIYL